MMSMISTVTVEATSLIAWARQVETLYRGALVMMEIRIPVMTLGMVIAIALDN